MSKNIYVVTNPTEGWDCVCGVYQGNSEEEVMKQYIAKYGEEVEDVEKWFEDNNLIVHESSLTIIK
jgi:hypothetical protein